MAELRFDPIPSASGNNAPFRSGVESPIALRDEGPIELLGRQFRLTVVDTAASAVHRAVGGSVAARMAALPCTGERVLRISDEQEITKMPFAGPPLLIDGALKPGLPGSEMLIVNR
ncbi:hypothetical protein OOK39_11220 [Streptomyces sp. NBC_00264]|uniref:hypothetical protein n=1 Tax=unclassified Streptomyces TaxID=2593676 RepID=UPI00225283D6|nr:MULTISPECIES: hypothetical protein [unclassified Streptomyces]WSX01147.1 hypothetical protein OG355_12270 [Streptomyces sp. NBC_00987]MCX4397004.1 hypothetical protein [Streptomyces sp. NBC_01767]MCX5100301.1 hypothetical protein [Streptomyces sp. NBC_00439]MCX5159845.1 hypothetical protein [Streptomyces sp. NBC_00305]MCX5218368.1 hypothetical protein [Streptomyces sp. NBC_00264]